MTFRYEETTNKFILYFPGATILSDAGAHRLDHGVADLCRRARDTGKRLVLDFQGVDVMSSAAIGALVLLNKHAKEQQVDVRVAHVGPTVGEVFRITRLTAVFRPDDEDT